MVGEVLLALVEVVSCSMLETGAEGPEHGKASAEVEHRMQEEVVESTGSVLLHRGWICYALFQHVERESCSLDCHGLARRV